MRKIKVDPSNHEDPRINAAAEKALNTALASFQKHKGKTTERKQIRRIFEAGRTFEAQIAIQGINEHEKILEILTKEITARNLILDEIRKIAHESAGGKFLKNELIVSLGLIEGKAGAFEIMKEEEKKA